MLFSTPLYPRRAVGPSRFGREGAEIEKERDGRTDGGEAINGGEMAKTPKRHLSVSSGRADGDGERGTKFAAL